MSTLDITRGGTYGGIWDAVNLRTVEPVILQEATIRGTGINANFVNGWDLTVRRCDVLGADAWDSPRWLTGKEWKRLVVENNEIVNTRGIELSPNRQPNPITLIRYNRHRNIKGTTRGGALADVGNFVQLRVIWGGDEWASDRPVNNLPGVVEIAWNEIINEHNKSNPEDVFSFYKSGHIRCHDNLINGQTKPDGWGESSQNSITLDPADEAYLLVDIMVERNFVIGAYSIGAFGGPGNRLDDNFVVSDGYIEDTGIRTVYGYSGMFIGTNGTVNTGADGNEVGYVNGTLHGSQRVDYQKDGGTWTNNISIPGPITRQTELAYIAKWRQRVAAAGITIGKDAGGDPPMTDLVLNKLSETSSKITFGWTPVPNAIGYRFQSATQAPKWSHSWDPTKNSVTFSKAAWYKVQALGVEAAGEYPFEEPTPGLLLDEQWDSIDPARWQKRWWWGGDTYYHDQTEELQAYRDANVTVQNGLVSLTAKREDVTDFQGRAKKFTSGYLGTNGIQGSVPRGFTFTYGKIEARIKAAKGPGMWSCFWLCDDRYESPWCDREIDIVEITGNNIEVANQNFHAAGTSAPAGKGHDTNLDLSAAFHVYGLEWRQNFLAWFVDGVETFRYSGPSIPTNPHYIMLNLQIGGPSSWAGTPPLDGSTLPSSMQVDWVKVSP